MSTQKRHNDCARFILSLLFQGPPSHIAAAPHTKGKTPVSGAKSPGSSQATVGGTPGSDDANADSVPSEAARQTAMALAKKASTKRDMAEALSVIDSKLLGWLLPRCTPPPRIMNHAPHTTSPACILTHTLTYTHSHTQSHTHSRTHSHSINHTRTLTLTLTHTLTH
jgi:hypothetical protein